MYCAKNSRELKRLLLDIIVPETNLSNLCKPVRYEAAVWLGGKIHSKMSWDCGYPSFHFVRGRFKQPPADTLRPLLGHL